ncbi:MULTISPECIES: S9 family peptidase [unclassified Sphingobacterium]|uniref:S9 family peptidase n=1 Tax=unclassified Sphingobacterium TaxID=2609468 RepID=UPI0025D76CA9|nr:MULTISPECIES: prolyl oligopeptidase family serine peptidase [unclassified Sphingobacterium]
MKKLCYGLLLLLSLKAQAQENITFQKPTSEILALADFIRPPQMKMSSDNKWMLFSYRATYKSLAELGQEEMKLAGLRINPRTNMESSTMFFEKIGLKRIGQQTEYTDFEGMPKIPSLSNFVFSPDNSRLAFTNTNDAGTALFVLDLTTKTVKQLTAYNLNATLDAPFHWLSNSKRLIITALPKEKKALLDPSKDLPTGPVVSTSDGKVSQLRTYQDLLKNPQDEQNFETLVESNLQFVDLDGTISNFKDKGIYTGLAFSPNGAYVMVTTIMKPYSYVVPASRFPQQTRIFDLSGKEIALVNEVPLTEVMPKGFSSTRPGRRSLQWRDDQPATLAYVKALDSGDASRAAEFRDALYTLDYPYQGDGKLIFKTKDRYAGVVWGNDKYALVHSQWYDTRNAKTFVVNPSTGESKLLHDRNSQDVYNDPGTVHQEKNAFGTYSMYIDKDKTLFVGKGFTKEGEFPFVEELDLQTLKKKRLYTAATSELQERIGTIVNPKTGELLVSLQSASVYPNYYLKNMKSGKQVALTTLENPFRSLEKVHKEILNYKRKDGVELSGTLYLPAGYDFDKKEKLPLLMWAYPREYKNKSTAGQSTANPKEFTFPSYGSFIYWVSKGYAVLDNAAFPIVGEGKKEPNDSFIEQLVANAEAAINAVDKLGYIDRKKVAVGGHSYGAFMTAHLLSNSKLFAAGIARSGAYNRTLTPFGFQSEQRNFWDDPKLYMTMSPFVSADRMKTPLLLVHGGADNNPGTFTLQTERYFQALKNLGAPVRMVILPREAHGYVAKENIFHLLWEQDQFLEKYLKN